MRIVNSYFFLLLITCFLPESASCKIPPKPSVQFIPATPEQQAIDSDIGHIFYTENFPKNKNINIFSTRLITKDRELYKPSGSFTLGNHGEFIVNKTPLRFYAFKAKGFARGETAKYQFKLDNGKVIAETEYIAFPFIETSIMGTFSIEARLQAIFPTIYTFHFKGLNESEPLQFITRSGDEKGQREHIYKSGDVIMYMPGVINCKGGYGHATYRRKSGDEVTISVPWDRAIIEELIKSTQENKQ